MSENFWKFLEAVWDKPVFVQKPKEDVIRLRKGKDYWVVDEQDYNVKSSGIEDRKEISG